MSVPNLPPNKRINRLAHARRSTVVATLAGHAPGVSASPVRLVMSGLIRALLPLTVSVLVALATACGGGDFTETFIPSFVGYDGDVYAYVDQVGVSSGVPDGFIKVDGRAYSLFGEGPFHKEKGAEGWAVYRIPDKPTRVAVPNSWGGGYTFFNIYELDRDAKWKQ